MDRVERKDVSGIKEIQKTPQGFLKIPAYLTRVGVLDYRRADGSLFRELRLPEEVFAKKSLDSLKSVPVTDLHPASFVNPDNYQELSKGIVLEDVKQDGRFVSSTVLVQDGNLIRKVEKRDACELSPGYTCFVEESKGIWQGEHYDGIQREIVYNHLAVGPRNWARSGSEVSLRLDSNERTLANVVNDALQKQEKSIDDLAKVLQLDPFAITYRLDGWETPDEDFLAGVSKALNLPLADLLKLNPGVKIMATKTLKIDGKDVTVEETVAPLIEGLQAKLDAAKAELDSTKAHLDAARDPVVIAKAVAERVALESKARTYLGADAKLDGKSDTEIRSEVILKVSPTAKLDGKSAEYVAIFFDALSTVDFVTQQKADAGTRTTENVAPPEKKTDSRQAMIERNAKLSSQPLGSK